MGWRSTSNLSTLSIQFILLLGFKNFSVFIVILFFSYHINYLFKPSSAISKGVEDRYTGYHLIQGKKVSLRSHILFWSLFRVQTEAIVLTNLEENTIPVHILIESNYKWMLKEYVKIKIHINATILAYWWEYILKIRKIKFKKYIISLKN